MELGQVQNLANFRKESLGYLIYGCSLTHVVALLATEDLLRPIALNGGPASLVRVIGQQKLRVDPTWRFSFDVSSGGGIFSRLRRAPAQRKVSR